LLSAPWVIPIATPTVAEGAVVVDANDLIVAVGTRSDLRQQFPQLPEERGEGVLLPGLVNAHTHLELSALSGRVEGGNGLVPWAMEVGREAGRFKVEQRYDAAERAAQALRAFGTAAVGDVGNTLLAVSEIGNADLRGLFFHELLGSREAATGDALADAEAERQDFLGEEDWPAGLGYVPAPHAPYSAGPELLRRIFAAAAGHPTTIHAAEDADEVLLLRDGTGRWAEILARMGVPAGSRTPGLGPVAYLASLGAFTGPQPPLLVHMVHASAEDLALTRQHGATVVLCPRSNLHIGGRLADVPALLAAKVRLALGTDSLASAPDLSLWGEMTTLAARFPNVAPETWLHMATQGGAEGLGLQHMGTLAPGKRPGIIDVQLTDGSSPVAALVRNPHAQIRWLARA
jgi:cytosine/adenosine deaminase-related metal-dependent hydrolase